MAALRSERVSLLGVGLVALAVRVVVVLVTHRSFALINDAADYNRLAISLAGGHGFGVSHVAPGGGPGAVAGALGAGARMCHADSTDRCRARPAGGADRVHRAARPAAVGRRPGGDRARDRAVPGLGDPRRDRDEPRDPADHAGWVFPGWDLQRDLRALPAATGQLDPCQR